MKSLFYIRSGSCLIAVVMTIIAFGISCSEEGLVAEMQDNARVSFDVSISGEWENVKTRSAERKKNVTSTKMDNSDLWLITTVESNGDTTLFDAPKSETRANPYAPTTDGENDSRLTDFGVYAWTYTGDWSTTANKKLYISGDKVTQDGEVWSFNPPKFWPGYYQMKFFAYAPYSFSNGNNITIDEQNGTPVISYITATDARNQQDLLVTTELTSAPGNYNQALPLKPFSHILTAINVNASDNLGRTITNVKFSGIKQSGTYTHGATVWQTTGEDVEISCNNVEKTLGETVTEIITDDDETTFMMIPQSLENAKIEITLRNDAGNEETLYASLPGEWKKGERVTYTLSLTDETIIPTIDFEYDKIEFNYKGQTYNASGTALLSYQRSSKYQSYVTIIDADGNERTEIRAWTARFVEENNGKYIGVEKPDWITSNVSYSGNGNIGYSDKDRYTLYVKEAEILPNMHNLRFKSAVTDYDLSTGGKAGTDNMNTANCYIVNAPGTYKFPLVYGNAIKDGKDNKDAYSTTSLNETQALQTFLNHADREITNPWIANNYNADGTTIKPYDAILLWEDTENGLISNVSLTGTVAEDYRVNFEITTTDIKQGNAIIAVRDASGTILWSWHIWVTDYEAMSGPEIIAEYDNTITQKDKLVQTSDGNNTYTFMGVPLGWCDGDSYKENKIMLELTQEGTGAKAYLTIIQRPSFLSGNAPYYQWGRKDPMMPFSGNVEDPNAREKAYTMHNGYALGDMGRRASIGEAIQQPHTYIQYPLNIERDWYLHTTENVNDPTTTVELRFLNLWNMNISYDTHGLPFKTVYDPSPVGYVVPPTAAMSAITFGGRDVTPGGNAGSWNWSLINSPYTDKNDADSNHGWMFYCNRMSTSGVYDVNGGIIYIPALGHRGYNLGNYVGTGDEQVSVTGISTCTAVYWACDAGKDNAVSNDMKVSINEGMIPQSSDISGHAIPVRPVREYMSVASIKSKR